MVPSCFVFFSIYNKKKPQNSVLKSKIQIERKGGKTERCLIEVDLVKQRRNLYIIIKNVFLALESFFPGYS